MELFELINPFLILGIDESASEIAIAESFQYLDENLKSINFPPGSFAQDQANRCMVRVNGAYQCLKDQSSRELARQQVISELAKQVEPEDMKPFLGHICVAAGIISIDELDDAVKQQSDIDLPLGQILQEKALLSQTELDGLLMGQRLFGSSVRPLDTMTRRLLALDAVSRDMIKIVLIDQRTNFVNSIPELLVIRGWLSDSINRILEDQKASRAPSTT